MPRNMICFPALGLGWGLVGLMFWNCWSGWTFNIGADLGMYLRINGAVRSGKW